MDALRAFALLGILVNHAAGAFLVGPEPDPMFNIFNRFDEIVDRLADLFTSGKFFAIFSFLFGLSFAIQLENAARHGRPFSGRFAWRLVVLWVLGFLHSLFFSGDILMIYAVLGLLLIPFQRVGNKALLAIAVVLAFNAPGLCLNAVRTIDPPTRVEDQDSRAEAQWFSEFVERHYRVKQSGTLAELVSINVAEMQLLRAWHQVFSGRLWVTFGLFLLGLYAGRKKLFCDTAEHRRIFRHIVVWAGITAALTTGALIILPGGADATPLALAVSAANSVQQVSLAAFYVAALTLTFWTGFPNVMAALAPLGKMGLTTYLTQSLFGVAVFYGLGLGLLGRIGVTSCVTLSLGFFVLQFFFARWWLQRFNLGPAEWLWRSLTYLEWQPIAKRA